MAVQFNGTSRLVHWDGLPGIHVTAPVGSHHDPFSISMLVYPVTDAEIWWSWFNFVDHWTGWYLEHIGSTTVSAAFSQEELDLPQWNTKAQKTGLVLNQWNQIGGRWTDTTSKFAVVNGLVGPENTAGFHAYEDPNHGGVTIGGAWRGLGSDVWPWEAHKLPGMGPEVIRAGNRAAEFGVWNRALTDAEWALLGPVGGVLGSPLLIPNGLIEYTSLLLNPDTELGGDSGGTGFFDLATAGAITFVAHPPVRKTIVQTVDDPPPGPGEANRPTLPTPCNFLMSNPANRPNVTGGTGPVATPITVGSGTEDLYNALGLPTGKTGPTPCLNADGSHKGNVYNCPPGAVYSWFELPPTTGAGWTTIQSSSPTFPAFGTRMMGRGGDPDLSFASHLYTIETGGPHAADENACLNFPWNSPGWRIIGARCRPSATIPWQGGQGLIWVGADRVSIERCWVHGYTVPNGTTTFTEKYGEPDQAGSGTLFCNAIRGIVVREDLSNIQIVHDTQIWDTWVGEIKHHDGDNQAIYCQLNDRTHIENCHIESVTENLMVGTQQWGAYGENVTALRNHIYKPPRWFKFMPDGTTLNPVWDGITVIPYHIEDHAYHPELQRAAWQVMKNLVETKVARRILLEGNLLENMWRGAAIVVNTQDLDMDDLTVRHNIFKKCATLFTVGAQTLDNGDFRANHRHRWYNNLGLDIYALTGFFSWTAIDHSFEHNTIIPLNTSVIWEGSATPHRTFAMQGVDFDRSTVKRNILGYAPPTAQQPTSVGGIVLFSGTFAQVLPTRVWAENALYDYNGQDPGTLPPGGAGFVTYSSLAAAGVNPDGTLTGNSPLRVGHPSYFGTDGKNLGVDFDLLNAAQGGTQVSPTPPAASFSATRIPNTLTVQLQDTSV